MTHGDAQFYEIYRQTTLGSSLMESLDELIAMGQITPQLAIRIVSIFDRSCSETLQERIRSRVTFRGHLDTYRFCDDVWTFIITNAEFKFEGQVLLADRVKIVACNSRTAEIEK